jgi:predicted nucleic acid-binding protein
MSWVFVDTNIFAYARDQRASVKQPIAEAWLASLARRRAGRISTQVLIEYYAVATHPQKLALPETFAQADIRELMTWNPLAPDAALFDAAWRVQDRHGLSWWDALIVAAALLQGCVTLLSEDLQHGLRVDGVAGGGFLTVANPFDPTVAIPN